MSEFSFKQAVTYTYAVIVVRTGRVELYGVESTLYVRADIALTDPERLNFASSAGGRSRLPFGKLWGRI